MTTPSPEEHTPDPARLKDIVSRAIALPKDDRAAFLAQRCAGDERLRADAAALVAAHEAAGSFMGSPTQTGAGAQNAPTVGSSREAGGPGTRIGAYKLLELIGEGGFGSVFMADQVGPLSRRVALKIIKPGMDSRMVAARFEAERQALALMDHPHIARVFDGGVTEPALGSRPYFVMEYVRGDPITAFADAHRLSVGERLQLFQQVCLAVQHAHTKGIIHRDLKPGNVLVSMTDGRPFAKVIDFGIAKATGAAGGRLTDKTLFTEHRQLIGTPEYMSPEQAQGSTDLDTRTDIYALGVLLYELLTGATPIDGARLRSAALGEMQRILKEEDPPIPSVRLSRSLPTLAAAAAARKAEPGRLGTMIRGELDWIVMKALDKDRARRYESAGQLAADVGRHLTGEAVLAAPPGTAYRLWKFVRRHRAAVMAATAVSVALLLGIAGTTTAMVWALREKERADREARSSTQIASIVALFSRALSPASLPSEEDGYDEERAEEPPPSAEPPESLRLLVAQLDAGVLANSAAAEIAIRLAVVKSLSPNESRAWGGDAILEGGVALAERALGSAHPTTEQLLTELCAVYHDNAAAERDPVRLGKARDFNSKLTAVLESRMTNPPKGTIRQWASELVSVSSEYQDKLWSAAAALGEPDTFRYGDYGSAWAPKEMDGGEEFIVLAFQQPVFATCVVVRETSSNGFVRRIDLIDDTGAEHLRWVGTDPSQPGAPVNNYIQFEPTQFLVRGVRILLDTDGGSWEEIDAVQLIGDPCKSQQRPAAEAARQADLQAMASERETAEGYVSGVLAGSGSLESLEAAIQADISVTTAGRLSAVVILRGRIQAIQAEAARLFERIASEAVVPERVLREVDLLGGSPDRPPDRVYVLLQQLAADWHPDLYKLNTMAWNVVKVPGADAERVQVALEVARRGVQRIPNNWSFQNTFAFALFRAGHRDEALVEAQKASKMDEDASPYGWATRAIIHCGLGQVEIARELVTRLRQVTANPRWTGSADLVALIAEAEQAVQASAQTP